MITPAPDSVTTSYQYDLAGDMTQSTDGANNVTSYAYDALGRKVSTTNPDKTVDTVTYDPAGNVTAQASLATDGKTVLAATSATYDGEGDKVSATDYRTATPPLHLRRDGRPDLGDAAGLVFVGHRHRPSVTTWREPDRRIPTATATYWTPPTTRWNLPQNRSSRRPARTPLPANTTTTTSTTPTGPDGRDQPGGVSQTYSYDAWAT